MLAPLQIDWTTYLIIKNITLSHKAMWTRTLHQYILIFSTYLCAIDFQWPLQSYLFYGIAVYCIIMVLFCVLFYDVSFCVVVNNKKGSRTPLEISSIDEIHAHKIYNEALKKHSNENRWIKWSSQRAPWKIGTQFIGTFIWDCYNGSTMHMLKNASSHMHLNQPWCMWNRLMWA